MTNFFNYNFTFPLGMNGWFMPNWSFPNYFAQFQIPYFNIFNMYSVQNPSFYYPDNINMDTFTRFSKGADANNNLKLNGYNAFKGERLANIALKNRNRAGFNEECAKYVKYDICEAGLGYYQYGHAYQMPRILRNNWNFKEISPEGINVSELPAGCVLVYDKNTEGFNEYGHTEITIGDGRAVSDGIAEKLDKKPSTIFIPV